jgi:hypothetical protein
MALFSDERLDGGLDAGAWLRPDGGIEGWPGGGGNAEGRPGGGGNAEGRPGGGGSIDARPVGGGGIDGVRDKTPGVRIESGARLDGGLEGGGIVLRVETGAVSRLDGGLASPGAPPSRDPRSFSLISNNPRDH